MSTRAASKPPSVVTCDRLAGAADVARDDDRAVRGAVAQQHLARALELLAARLGGRVVEREREVGGAGGLQPALDDRPRLALVRQRDDREVVAQRRADAGGGGVHRRQAGHDAQVDVGVLAVARLDRLEHGGGHREDARVAGGHDGDAARRRRRAPARGGRGPSRRGCRWSGGAGRRAAGRDRGTGRSRRARRRRRARRSPRASASPARRGRARRPRAGRGRLSAASVAAAGCGAGAWRAVGTSTSAMYGTSPSTSSSAATRSSVREARSTYTPRASTSRERRAPSARRRSAARAS